MHGTPTEVTVANALAEAMAEEQRERIAREQLEADEPEIELVDITCAALLRLRRDQQTSAYIKDVVFVDDDEPIPYEELADPAEGQIVCIDLTDGGTVWCYDLNGEPHWLPEAEFQVRTEQIHDEAEDDEPELPLSTVLWTITAIAIIGIALAIAFWLQVLPSGH